MPTEIIHNLNWIDVLIGIVIGRALFVGFQEGTIVETFKILGVFFAIVFSLHFCHVLAGYMQLAMEFGYVVVFIFLSVLIVVAFKFIREGLLVVFKMETHSLIDQWGGLIIAVGRGFLVSSLVIVGLLLAGDKYFKEKVGSSMTGQYFANLAPHIYESFYEGAIVKFFPSEKLNKKILALGQSPVKKK